MKTNQAAGYTFSSRSALLYKKRLDWEVGRYPIVEQPDGLCDLARLICAIAVKPDVAERLMGVTNCGLLRAAHKNAISELKNTRGTRVELDAIANWEVV